MRSRVCRSVSPADSTVHFNDCKAPPLAYSGFASLDHERTLGSADGWNKRWYPLVLKALASVVQGSGDNLEISERAEAIESPKVIGIPEWN